MVALRSTQSELEIRFRTNSKGVTYPQYFKSDGTMVGCGCDESLAVTVEKYNFKPCHHRMTHNAAMQAITGEDLAPHIEEELLNSCCTCGYPTKGVICFRCLQ